MRKRPTVLFCFLLFAWAAIRVQAQAPRLVVVIVIDQMRADYLERFRSQFVPGGFERLLREGAVFADCLYDYDSTETAPGHAVLATGSYPRQNGIIQNAWYDRAQKKAIGVVEDERHRLVASPPLEKKGASPWALQGTTVGDELRMQYGRAAQVVGISWKDRAAILTAGKNPTAAFWFDPDAGGFVTSTYYGDSLPEWVVKFNQTHTLESYRGKRWTPLQGRTFEHTLEVPPAENGRPAFWLDFQTTPFATEELFQFAESAMEAYKLGADSTPDLLWISLSATDYLGHNVGPDSEMVRDLYLRVDRQLAGFLSAVEQRVGRTNLVLALSADHGVAPLPERTQAERFGGGRQNIREIAQEVDRALAAQFGPEKWVEDAAYPSLYLNYEAIARRGLDPEKVAGAAGEAALRHPGVAAYYTARQLSAGSLLDPLAALYTRSYYAGRNGDVILRYAPFFPERVAPGGTSHGSPYTYDRHVPLILWGRSFRASVYYRKVSPADLAPTLAAILKINPPALAGGRILEEAMQLPTEPVSPATRSEQTR